MKLTELVLLFSAIFGLGSANLYMYNEYEIDCPGADSPTLMRNDVPHWGTPGRPFLTVPPGLIIAQSRKIPKAGFGVIATTFIRAHTWLGEYDGEILTPDQKDYMSWYTWTVHRNGGLSHFVDGQVFESSNHLRYVNCPNRQADENVDVLECYGRVMYITKKHIAPGDELFVFYGEGYAKELGIDMDEYRTGIAKPKNVTVSSAKNSSSDETQPSAINVAGEETNITEMELNSSVDG